MIKNIGNNASGGQVDTKQKIISSAGNSTTDQLTVGATFTGVVEETFGINGIQVYTSSDQNCLIEVEQGLSPTEFEINDSYTCYENVACTRTFTSVAPYFRIKITNTGTATTTTLKASVGMTPMINVLPRALSILGNLQVVSSLRGDENTERHVWVNPTSELAISPVYRLVGTTFDGSTKDPNFWTDNSTDAGEVTQSGGEIELTTNKTVATANSTAIYTSVRRARFVAGSAMFFNCGVNWVTAGTENNVRRVGAFDATDGFFFELDGTTFSIGTRRASSDTLVNSGSFNGNVGSVFVPTADTYYNLSIEYSPLGAFFYVNKRLLHKISQAHLSDTNTLPINIENINSGGITTNVVFDSVGMYITRQGELVTSPNSKYQSGTTAQIICKYGAGVIRGIIISGIANTSVVTLYDGLVAGGNIIWSTGALPLKQEPIDIPLYNIPFNTGLSFAITDANCNVLLVYE